MSLNALVVDDSRAMRNILRRILEGYGFEVVEAGHGVEGWSQLGKMPLPDVALVDWNMPEMNGLDFVKKVRDDERFDTMPIMMVTTESEARQLEAALAAGANEYLVKPFTAEGLREKLALLGFYEQPA